MVRYQIVDTTQQFTVHSRHEAVESESTTTTATIQETTHTSKKPTQPTQQGRNDYSQSRRLRVSLREVSSALARPGSHLGRDAKAPLPPQVRAGSRKARTDLELSFKELGAVFAPCDSNGAHHHIFQRTPVANRQSFAIVVQFRQQDVIPLPCERSCRTISYKWSILM